MIGKTLLSVFEMNTIEEYFEYIIESRTNGQHKQARELFGLLSEGMQGQRAQFFAWFEETYHYEAQDSDEMDELMALRNYFKTN